MSGEIKPLPNYHFTKGHRAAVMLTPCTSTVVGGGLPAVLVPPGEQQVMGPPCRHPDSRLHGRED